MNELVNLIVKKTGIPSATAQNTVNVVLDYLKKKLPAPVAAQVSGLLSGGGEVKAAENVLGNLTSKFGKK